MRMLEVLADGAWHSGEELANAEQISRSAVWQRMNALREMGIDLFAVRGRGYRLREPLDLLCEQAIRARLPVEVGAIDVECLGRTTSTNALLMDRGPLEQPLVLLAEYQQAGRGRRGRRWLQPYASGLCLSVGWDGDSAAALALLPLAAGVRIVETLGHTGFEHLALKWPNDIFHNQQKLGGILIEHRGEVSGSARTVVGIGLNVRLPAKFDADGAMPTCLERAWPASPREMPGRSELAAQVIAAVLDARQLLVQSRGAQLLARWQSFDWLCGQQVVVQAGELRYKGEYRGVAEDGALMLTESDGQTRRFHSGEVSLRPGNPD